MQANIAKLCYALAKTTINSIKVIVASVQTHATKSRDVGAKTMTKLLNLGRVSVQTYIAELCYAAAKTMTNSINLVVVSVQPRTTVSGDVEVNQSSILAMEHRLS